MAPADARDLVRDTAARATANTDKVSPFVLDGPPYVQKIVLAGRADAGHLLRAGFKQLDGTTFVKTAQRLQDLYI